MWTRSCCSLTRNRNIYLQKTVRNACFSKVLQLASSVVSRPLPSVWSKVVFGRMRELALCRAYTIVILLATMIAASAAPQDSPSEPAEVPATVMDGSAGDKYGSRRRRAGGRRLYHVDVTDSGEPCMPNPLWSRVVDPDDYEFGCREIEVRCFIGIEPHVSSELGLPGARSTTRKSAKRAYICAKICGLSVVGTPAHFNFFPGRMKLKVHETPAHM